MIVRSGKSRTVITMADQSYWRLTDVGGSGKRHRIQRQVHALVDRVDALGQASPNLRQMRQAQAARAARAAETESPAGGQPQQQQQGRVVLRRLRGRPGATNVVQANHTITFGSAFDTVGAPESMAETGKVFYEVELLKFTKHSCAIQFGWASAGLKQTDSSTNTGVGDDRHGWGLDGARGMKWFGGSSHWDIRWKQGDTLGFAADLEANKLLFGHNGEWSVAFEDVQWPEGGIYPALTASSHSQQLIVRLKFEANEWEHGPPDETYGENLESRPSWAVVSRSTANSLECKCLMCALDSGVFSLQHGEASGLEGSLAMMHAVKQMRRRFLQPLHDLLRTLDLIQSSLPSDKEEPKPEPEPGPEPEPDSSVFRFRATSPTMSEKGESGDASLLPEVLGLGRDLAELRAQLGTTLERFESRGNSLHESTDVAAHLAKMTMMEQLDVLDEDWSATESDPAAGNTIAATQSAVGLLSAALRQEAAHYVQVHDALTELNAIVAKLVKSTAAVRQHLVSVTTSAAALIEEAEAVRNAGTKDDAMAGLLELQAQQKNVRKSMNRAEFDMKEAKLEEDTDAVAAAEARLADHRKNAIRVGREIREEEARLVRLARDFFPELLLERPEIAEIELAGCLENGRKKSHYTDLKPLSGGRHRCWAATYGDDKVVLKEFNMGSADDRKKYEREFKIQEKLRHPRLLQLQAAFVDDSCVYAQFPYISGGNMRQWLLQTELPIAQRQRVCYEVATGLSYLHSKLVVHCDMKQENVLIGEDGPLIADFETSKDTAAQATTTTMTAAGGTVGYLAPELTSGSGKPSVPACAHCLPC
eukprot:COSAG04_NODE_1038_length_8607_cov_2.977433_10_plen_819_part_00